MHKIENSWFSGEAFIPSYELEELLGTKMRALYQRSKGRDLFDLYFALKNTSLSIYKILECYKKYMEFSNERAATSREFIINMEDKMKDVDFIGDIKGLFRPDFRFNIDEAYKLVKQKLLERI